MKWHYLFAFQKEAYLKQIKEHINVTEDDECITISKGHMHYTESVGVAQVSLESLSIYLKIFVTLKFTKQVEK